MKVIDRVYLIETVDSEKLANSLEGALKKAGRPVNIFVQVNTSGEEGGVSC